MPNQLRRRNQILPVCRALLTHPWLPIFVAILAVILTLPSLSAGLFLDDYFHKLILQGRGGVIHIDNSRLDIFRFFGTRPEQMREMIDSGLWPWWTYPGIKAAFWRPLTSLTHWLDYKLWPDSPPLMHLHSILWYALLVIAVGCLYRRMMGPSAAAGLAMILYAVDDTHALPVSFLANRNSLPAAVFGILTLLAHDSLRRRGWRLGAVIAPLMLAASLLFKEEGIATFAYLFAYALFVDEDRLWKRWSSLAPYVIVIVIWRIVWVHLGYGVANIGYYTDPLQDPLRFGQALIPRASSLLLAQLGGVPAGVELFPSRQGEIRLLAGTAVFLAILALALWPTFRENRLARFWTVGMVLSIIPMCATFPDGRMLILPGIGAMALVAMLVTRTFSGRAKVRFRPAIVALCGLLIVIHMVISVPLLMLRSCGFKGIGYIIDRVCLTQPFDPGVEKQDLVVVNPPISFTMLESQLEWAARGDPMPRHMRVLASSLLQPVEVRRMDQNTLVVTPGWGYIVSFDDRLLRSEEHPLRKGEIIRLTGMTARIIRMTHDGRPLTVEFRFAVPLEDRSLRWLQWNDNRYIPFHPPAVGKSVTLPGPPGGFRDVLQR